MKKRFFLPAILLVTTAMLYSCDKCKICTKPSQNDVRVCRGNYDSDGEYDLAISGYEFLGYTCQ